MINRNLAIALQPACATERTPRRRRRGRELTGCRQGEAYQDYNIPVNLCDWSQKQVDNFSAVC